MNEEKKWEELSFEKQEEALVKLQKAADQIGKGLEVVKEMKEKGLLSVNEVKQKIEDELKEIFGE